jgi:hypothetical protein
MVERGDLTLASISMGQIDLFPTLLNSIHLAQARKEAKIPVISWWLKQVKRKLRRRIMKFLESRLDSVLFILLLKSAYATPAKRAGWLRSWRRDWLKPLMWRANLDMVLIANLTFC